MNFDNFINFRVFLDIIAIFGDTSAEDSTKPAEMTRDAGMVNSDDDKLL